MTVHYISKAQRNFSKKRNNQFNNSLVKVPFPTRRFLGEEILFRGCLASTAILICPHLYLSAIVAAKLTMFLPKPWGNTRTLKLASWPVAPVWRVVKFAITVSLAALFECDVLVFCLVGEACLFLTKCVYRCWESLPQRRELCTILPNMMQNVSLG